MEFIIFQVTNSFLNKGPFPLGLTRVLNGRSYSRISCCVRTHGVWQMPNLAGIRRVCNVRAWTVSVFWSNDEELATFFVALESLDFEDFRWNRAVLRNVAPLSALDKTVVAQHTLLRCFVCPASLLHRKSRIEYRRIHIHLPSQGLSEN